MGGYIGARAGSLSTTTVANVQDVTATDTTPEVTIINNTHEDTDGGREGKVIFKGQQSGGEESTLAEIQASHDGTADDEKGDLIFRTNDGSDGASPTQRMKIDSAGDLSLYEDTGATAKFFWDASAERLGLGTVTPDASLDIESATPIIRLKDTDTNAYSEVSASSGDGNIFIKADEGNGVAASGIRFHVDGSHVCRVQDTKFFLGKTTAGIDQVGAELRNGVSNYALLGTSSGYSPLILNRTTSDGNIVVFRKDNAHLGIIGSNSGNLVVEGSNATGKSGIEFGGAEWYPRDGGSRADNAIDLGNSSYRFDDIYATNSSIQTSDENEKQNIASLTSAEITAATAISKLFKTFKWKDKVAAKGDAARTHAGIIAQQVETAMSDAGLDAGNYAFFISTTWWEADETYTDDEGAEQTRTNTYNTQEEAPEGATERTRMGIRYPELLSFIGAATEQRLTSIEARLDALEAE